MSLIKIKDCFILGNEGVDDVFPFFLARIKLNARHSKYDIENLLYKIT